MNSHAISRAITDADPLAHGQPVLPSIDDEISAARAVVVPGRRRRSWPRPLRLTVAVVGVAAAVVVTLVATNALSGPGSAAAAELRTVIANTETSPPIPFEVRTYRTRGLDWVPTSRGPAYYWQTSTVTQTTSATLDTYRTVDAAPEYLTAADARRADSLPVARRPHPGTSTQRTGCVSGLRSSCWPNPAGVAALPDTPRALAASLPVTCRSTTTGRPCLFDELEVVLEFGGTTGRQRAAILTLMAEQPGVTVLGIRTVDGEHGLTFHVRFDPENDEAAYTLVIDPHDGDDLAQFVYKTARSDHYSPTPVPDGRLISSSIQTGS